MKFVGNGGTPSYSTKTVTYDSMYGPLSTGTKTGYALEGWYTSMSGGNNITSSTKVTLTSDHTLYAHWAITHIYSVSDLNTFSNNVNSGTTYSGTTMGLYNDIDFSGDLSK